MNGEILGEALDGAANQSREQDWTIEAGADAGVRPETVLALVEG